MKYNLLNLITICFCIFLNAQDAASITTQESNLKKLVKSGKLTLVNGEIIDFSNLTYENNEQVKYINSSTQLEEHLFLPSINNIEENEIVFIDQNIKIKTDTLFRASYPEGIYVTKDDFLRKHQVNWIRWFQRDCMV